MRLKIKWLLFLLSSVCVLSAFTEKPSVMKGKHPGIHVAEKRELMYLSIPLSSEVYYFANGCKAWMTVSLIAVYDTDRKIFIAYSLSYPKRHYECPEEPTIYEYETRLGIRGDDNEVTEIYTLEKEDDQLREMFGDPAWVKKFVLLCNKELQKALN